MEKEHFFENKTYGCRLDTNTAKLLNDNYQYITGTDETLFFREFFIRLLDKALANKETQSKRVTFAITPETEVLQDEIKQLKTDIQTLEQQNNELTSQKIPEPPIIPISKPGSIVLEDVKPVEQWFIQQYAIQLQVTPKALLIDKMLMPFIKTGKTAPFKAPPANVEDLFSQLADPDKAKLIEDDIKEQKKVLYGK